MNAQPTTRNDLPGLEKTFLLDSLTSGQTNHLQHAASSRSLHQPTEEKHVRMWPALEWVAVDHDV